MKIVAKYIRHHTAGGIILTDIGLYLLGLPPLAVGLAAAPFWLFFAIQAAHRIRG